MIKKIIISFSIFFMITANLLAAGSSGGESDGPKTKSNYAKENAILIDDFASNIKRWEAAGGIGILHKNANDTIQQLKQLGL